MLWQKVYRIIVTECELLPPKVTLSVSSVQSLSACELYKVFPSSLIKVIKQLHAEYFVHFV